MSWRDDMRPGSFRGVPFYVRNTSDTQGRLAGVHQVFGSGEDPVGIAHDNGMALGVHDLEVFVGGDEYLDDLEALEAALLEPGPGDLIHPFRGSMLVVVLPGWRTTQDAIENGGIASISVTFKRASGQRGLRARVLPTESTRSAATATVAAGGADFAKKFSVADLPAAYQESTPTALARVGAVLADLESTIAGASAPVTGALSEVAALGQRAAGLLSAPRALADDVVASVGAVFESARAAADAARDLASLNPVAAVAEFRRLARALLHGARSTFALPELVPATDPVTVNRTREAENVTTLRALVLGTVVAETARTLTWTPYSSRSEATAALTEVLTLMDAVDLIADDEQFAALSTLRQQTSSYLKGVARTLPEVTTYTTAAWTSALLIAQELYGDATRADEVASRNRLANPSMIAPGLTLEVLAT